MKEITVTGVQEGQRLDRLLERYLRSASGSFIYKMLRKKNITLNDKKAHGDEKLHEGDVIRIWFSDETLRKFTAGEEPAPACDPSGSRKEAAVREYPVTDLDILYEDTHVILVNKPAGMLSQKAQPSDVSLCEYLIGYLLSSGQLSKETLDTFRPSVCSRLDRNTSGIVCCGKTSEGLRTLSELFRSRDLQKYYRCIVSGKVSKAGHIQGYLIKDESRNRVQILSEPAPGAKAIATEYEPVMTGENLTLLQVHLLTGRSHQIRAHLSSIGHPILGDEKYGDEKLNRYYARTCGVQYQMLHCWRLQMPVIEGSLSNLSEKVFTAPEPEIFQTVEKYAGLQERNQPHSFTG